MRKSMAKPKISVITISYNIASEIERTVVSIQGQDFKDFEWIVVDGQSSDGTEDILKRHKKFISKFISAKPAGPYDAMNKGLAEARGELICFINGGDELIDHSVLSDTWKQFMTSKTEILYGDAIICNEKGEDRLESYDIPLKRLLVGSMVNHQAIFCTQHAFRVVGSFDTQYRACADYDWLLRALYRHNISHLHFARPIARFHLGGVSTKIDVYAERRKIQQQYYNHYEKITAYIIKQQRYLKSVYDRFFIRSKHE
jgi:glycosyltransferase involved in cell wall biosynthesis